MTDKELIYKNLDKNFDVCTLWEELSVQDKDTGRYIQLNQIGVEFFTIFGEFTTDTGDSSLSLFNSWFEENRAKLMVKLDKCLNNINGKINLEKLILKVKKQVSNEKITDNYIRKKVKNKYYETILKPRLDEYLKSVNRDIGINDIINDFQKKHKRDMSFFETQIKEEIKFYYYRKLLIPRLDAYFKEFSEGLDLDIDDDVLLLETLNMIEGSSLGSIALYEKFADDLLYFRNKMTSRFNDYFNKVLVIPILDKYILSLEENIDSEKVINGLHRKLQLNGKFYSDFALNYVNNWYANTVVGVKMQDLLSQLVITPSGYDWRVTWIGHGKADKERIVGEFKTENGYQHIFLGGMYDEWYDEAVVRASEKLIK